jgi:hypothetical protein
MMTLAKQLAWDLYEHHKVPVGTVRSVAFRGQIVPRSWHSAVYWRVVVGIPQYVVCAKKLFLLWQSAAFDRGTWQKTEFQLPPFYIESLLRHKFLTRDFPGVSRIRGELFKPKLCTKGLS